MSRRKGKIPRISFGAAQPINLTDDNWRTIEAAYGQAVSLKTRAQIETATKGFLQFAQAENTGWMDDAVRRVSRLRKSAWLLITAIEAHGVADITRDYVDDELALSYARLNSDKISKLLGIRSAPLAAYKYVRELRTDLGRFVNACDLTLKEFQNASQQEYWPTGGAWKIWIRQLTEIFANNNLPTGARKDVNKNKRANPSPFVRFVGSLQGFLPKQYTRAIHSSGALVTAIYEARKESKPLVVLRKTRARKTGGNEDKPQRLKTPRI
jgi:hypothetical protein